MSATKEKEPASFILNDLPTKQRLTALRRDAKVCQRCHLYKNATQTVFGAGSPHARLMIVGEIPGKREDELGEPFTGPAGTYLRKSLVKCGINLKDIYFTNVVKHFKFYNINHKKIHRSPVTSEIKACWPWLEAEIDAIRPEVIFCLGLTAARTLISKGFRIKKQRGEWFKYLNKIDILATFHPSAILRSVTTQYYDEMNKSFIKDIKKVVNYLASSK